MFGQLYRSLVMVIIIFAMVIVKFTNKLLFSFSRVFHLVMKLMPYFNNLEELNLERAQIWGIDSAALNFSSIYSEAKIYYVDFFKTVKVGQPAPDTQVHQLDGTEVRLLDYCKPGRPFVLIFGSST